MALTMQEYPPAACQAAKRMNSMGKAGHPFLFVIDYDMQYPVIEALPSDDNLLFFDVDGFTQAGKPKEQPQNVSLRPCPVPFETYKKAFEKVMHHLQKGDSYLVNLTQPSQIESNLSLQQLFDTARAKYKLYWKDRFVVFSPETFVKIKDGWIYSYPMKGTIDATLPNAEGQLLNNEKERAEHLTMVDLIRNDLSRFATNVQVKKLCYLDLLKTHSGALWQMSSEIAGKLPPDFKEEIGTIIFSMLPAGSISGAPKKKTIEIIAEAEKYQRGFYTGIFGYFDGQKLDSAVMIRFIEKDGPNLIYKSGGGITAKSDLEAEYNELIQKIYVPVY